MTSFAKDFEPSIRAAAALGPKTASAGVPQLLADAGDERCLGSDHDEVDVQAPREREQPFAVLRPDGMAVAERARYPGSPARRGAPSGAATARVPTRARARGRPSRRGAPSSPGL